MLPPLRISPQNLKKTLLGQTLGTAEQFSDRKIAAVLAVFLETEQGPALLFTKRSPALGEHAGQVSFPGGALDPDDADLQSAALREAREEVGLTAGELEVLAPLPLQPVLDRWLIYPFAAWWACPRPLKPSPGEVERIIISPLSELISQHRRDCWQIPDPSHSCRYFISGELLWGATARITGRLLDRLLV